MKLLLPISTLLLVAALTASAQPNRQPDRQPNRPQAPDTTRPTLTPPPPPVDTASLRVDPQLAMIRVMTLTSPDSIVLRWGITNAAGWWKSRKVGFYVERIALPPGDAPPDSNAKVELLTPEPLRPWTVEQWRAAGGETNTMMGIAAQAMHGTFFATELANGPAEALRNRADEFRTRWGFAMLAADVEPRAAEGLALRFVDRTVQSGVRYVYRVSPAIGPDDSTLLLEPGITLAQAVPGPLPSAPTRLRTSDTVGHVALAWDNIPDSNGVLFSGFYIERAERGGEWVRITKDPVISIVNNAQGMNPTEEELATARYVDSIGIDRPHRYRVVGITAFGQVSPPSNEIAVELHDLQPPPSPIMIGATETRPGLITVQWRQGEDTASDLRGFHVARAPGVRGPYERLTTALLPTGTTSWQDPNPRRDTTNYYIVQALDARGNVSESMSAYAFMIDSTPPARPLALRGTIDTNGIVTLSWTLNRERDLLGYRIFRTNSLDYGYEMIPVTPGPVAGSSYTDTIVVRTLTRYIYYTIVAVDRNYNNSSFSDTLQLIRPDIIAPVPPLFVDATVSDTNVVLQWQPSTSRDVKSHQLYRRIVGESEWRVVGGTMGREASSYTDRDVRKRVIYEYMLVATDSSGLRSEESLPFTARPYDLGLRPTVGGLKIAKAREGKGLRISWDYGRVERGERVRFVVYRGMGGEMMSQYTAVTGDLREYVDRDVVAGTSYTYAVRALSMADGSESPLGAAVTARAEE